MQNYPIFIDLNDQPCLMVGAGPVALRKIRLMLGAGAKITVIAPQICQELAEEADGRIDFIQRKFQDSDISGYRLITAATNDPTVNQQVSELAQSQNIPVNVVDSPELCSFITPSIIDRSPVLIAISTGGGAPVLARLLRAKIESLVPSTYGQLANAMASFRDRLKLNLSQERDRRLFWDKVVQGPIGEHFLSGRGEDGKLALTSAVNSATSFIDNRGKVALIGAGPGDPDLLTFKAIRLMQEADVVLYDRLVSKEILNMTRRDADRVYVGKKRAEHAVAQHDINQLLVDLALEGKNVVRLKGGDPYIFGRGGEEIELLAENNISFQIVPGVTAASGCATYAGIPLTHRDHAQSCLFVTGHLKDGTVNLNWDLLATPNQTVVIYMGLVGLPIICKKLIEHGVSSEMPIALVQQGTTQNQKVYTGTLGTMEQSIKDKSIQAPTLIIVGSVVSLQPKLAWFEPKPNDDQRHT